MIGIDLIEIERITKLKKRFGDKALLKFLSPEEMTLAKSDTTAAGFYAAKEAISKALGIGISEKCGFMDIKIYKDAKNAPLLRFHAISLKIITSLMYHSPSPTITVLRLL